MKSLKRNPLLLIAALVAAGGTLAWAADNSSQAPKIRAKRSPVAAAENSLQPDSDVVDAPTTGVLDDHGYSTRSRFYSQGGILEYVSFGVYPGLNLGASLAVDSIIGDERNPRMRAPTAQVKYRFFEGDQTLPSAAVGFDGQGYRYNTANKRFNQRQRGFYIVGSKEVGTPGLQISPSLNISDFDSNAVFGSLAATFNIRDRAEILLEWDNIANWSDSRVNGGLRVFITPNFHVDFAVRAIGTGGHYSDGAPRGPERVVQLKYSSSF
jgi:hypothetical protein